jgi:hypothetical protein
MMSKRQIILLVAMMGVLFTTAFANDNNEAKKDRSDIRKERRIYFQENIKPKVDAQRTKLEASLSESDKKEIKRLREEIIKQRLMQNEFQSEARAARIKGDSFDEGLYDEIQAQRIVIENLMDQAKLVANKYRPEIDELVTDLRADLRDQLMEDRDEIRQRRDGSGQGYGPGRRGQGPRGANKNRSFGRGHDGEFGPMRGGFGRGGFGMPGARGSLDIVAFLLWDVERG